MRHVRFDRQFCAAHRIWNDDSSCRRIHGHNYRVSVEVKSPVEHLTEQGFVVPFGKVKAIIDALDHRLLLDGEDPIAQALEGLNVGVVLFGFPPSTENLAQYLAEQIAGTLLWSSARVEVTLRENDSIEAHGFAVSE